MASKPEVEKFLQELKVKISVFGILFLDDRGKNQQALLDMEIAPAKRREIIERLTPEDYSEGPLPETMRGLLPMWVFGKTMAAVNIYIKITMGRANNSAVCISFHLAERPMNFPLKNQII